MAIREISKGKYQLIVDEMRNGKRFRKTKIVECGKRELNKLYDEFKIEVSKPTQDSCTVESLLKSYIDYKETCGLSPNTIRGYQTCAKRLNKAFKDVLAKDLSAYQIADYVASEVKETSHKGKTIHNSVSLLSSAYRYAIRMDLLSENPCDKLEPIKQEKTEKKILTEDEVKRFIECLYKEPRDNRVAFLLALFCGLRKSEILGIKETDINDFGSIAIQRARFDFGVKDNKTERSRRVCMPPKFVMDEIKLLIEEHKYHEYLIQYCYEPMKESYLGSLMRRFNEKYGFDITLHGLRHTFASMLNASGEFDIAEISQALGHANISITLNTYTHTFKNASQSVRRISAFGDKFDESLTQKTPKAL